MLAGNQVAFPWMTLILVMSPVIGLVAAFCWARRP
jgi:hypothetical protein